TNAPTEAPADPTAACPKADANTVLYVSKENGFCFVYPNSLKMNEGFAATNSIWLAGAPLDPNSMEPIAVGIEVAFNGPSDVATSADYAQKWYTVYGQGATAPIAVTIGGQSAPMIPDVPGMRIEQVGFVVANGMKYTLRLGPAPGTFDQLKDQ